MENAFEYKQRWTDELSRREKSGISGEDPIPHPNDVIIDMRTGVVRTNGPLDEIEKAAWDERLARRAEAQQEINYLAAKFRKARCPKKKIMWQLEWHFEQRIFDIINDAMPLRYKAKLENRSYRDGASREGQAMAIYHKRLG